MYSLGWNLVGEQLGLGWIRVVTSGERVNWGWGELGLALGEIGLGLELG